MTVKKSIKDRWQVMNLTDGILANPNIMSKQEAEDFIENFRKKYSLQGYYLTSNGDRIKPEDVVLKTMPIEK